MGISWDLLNYQRVPLKGQSSHLVWKAGVLGPLLFLTYINDFPDGITSKVFAGNRLIFSTIININILPSNLNNNTKKVAAWPFNEKKRLWQRYYPANFAKFVRMPTLKNIWKYTSVLEKYSWKACEKQKKNSCFYYRLSKDNQSNRDN